MQLALKNSLCLVACLLCSPLAAAEYDCAKWQAINPNDYPSDLVLTRHKGKIKSIEKRAMVKGKKDWYQISSFSKKGLLIRKMVKHYQLPERDYIIELQPTHSAKYRKVYTKTNTNIGQLIETITRTYDPDKRILTKKIDKTKPSFGDPARTEYHFSQTGQLTKVIIIFEKRGPIPPKSDITEYEFHPDSRLKKINSYTKKYSGTFLDLVETLTYQNSTVHRVTEKCEDNNCHFDDEYKYNCTTGYNRYGNKLYELYKFENSWVIPIYTSKESVKSMDPKTLMQIDYSYTYY